MSEPNFILGKLYSGDPLFTYSKCILTVDFIDSSIPKR